MKDPRFGLGTDQLEVSRQMAQQMPPLPQVPPQQRAASASLDPAAMGPAEAVRPGLADWAQQMQLPGVDT